MAAGEKLKQQVDLIQLQPESDMAAVWTFNLMNLAHIFSMREVVVYKWIFTISEDYGTR